MVERQKNNDELCAHNWLKQQGYRDIRRPSDDPPDFVVNGHYAVEVTRLNQRIVVGDNKPSKGEEQARIPLTNCIEEIVCKLGPPGNEGRSWVIDFEYDFSEPLPHQNVVTCEILKALAPLLKPYDDRVISGIHSRHLDYSKHADELEYLNYPHLCLPCGICLKLGEFSHSPAKFFLQNVSDGEDIGIAEELAKSIRNRICDKSKKVRNQNKVGEYTNWWLVLVDHVCHLPIQILSDDELSFIRDQKFDFWTRVVIVSSRNPGWHFDLLSR